MPRYFIELSYKGTNYSGFQIQKNANTVQSEVEKAFAILHGTDINLTGSSRTDAGVHAFQNYFHFDYESVINQEFIYKMNAILPADVTIKNIYLMPSEAHSRFDAISREYLYKIHRFKNPFIQDTSYFFPYKLDLKIMNEGASIIKAQKNFFAFSKTNTQVKNFNCNVKISEWTIIKEQLIYNIEANRFLRGMVRLLTASLLKLGRGKLTMHEFQNFFIGNVRCGYSVPPHGLFLNTINYPENYFHSSQLFKVSY